MTSHNPNLKASESHGNLHPILELAAREVFETMLGSHLEINPQPPIENSFEVTAMVGLAGLLCGVLTVRCSNRAGALMASKMLGVDPEKAGPEIWDALGEICNMVAGNFKNKISGLGDGCMLSVPTVITGGDYDFRPLGESTLRVNSLFEGEQVVTAIEIHS